MALVRLGPALGLPWLLATALLAGPSAPRTVYVDNPWVAAGALRLDVRKAASEQVPAGWRHADLPQALAQRDPYRLVKFSGPVGSRQRELLAAAGFEIIASYPYGSFLVRPAAGRSAADPAGLDEVAWVGPFHPYFKLDAGLAAALAAGDARALLGDTPNWGLRLTIGLHEAEARPVAEAAIAATEGLVELLPTSGLPLLVRVEPQRFREFVRAVAALPEVAYVEPRIPVHVHNDENAQIGQSGSCNNNGSEAPNTTIFNQGITGWGSRIVVSDTCVDLNEGWFFDDSLHRLAAHEPNAPWDAVPPDWEQRKVVEYYDMYSGDTTIGCAGFSGCPSSSNCADHGSHVAGTATANCSLDLEGVATASDAANSDGDNDGMAPGAKLIVQDLGNQTLSYINTSGNLGELIDVAWYNTCLDADCGFDAHNSSWGADVNSYLVDSRSSDRALWEVRNAVAVTSAGNAGGFYDSVGTPANAKNIIAVGNGSECAADVVDNSSSRGQATDGRLKPDVVATGTAVTSAKNDGDGTTVANGGCTVWNSFGTSMASPTVTGYVGLLVQYFNDGFYPSGAAVAEDTVEPSGPLRKAMLVNTARRMTGSGAERSNVTWPNMDQGWGFVVLDDALYFSGDSRKLWVHDETLGVDATGTSSMSFQRKVTSAAEPLKVSLVWYDKEHAGGCSSTTPCIDNDLDLTVTNETTATTYSVTLIPGASGHVVPRTVVPSAPGVGQTTTDNGPDDLNTVEQVIIYDPTPDAIYTFTVTAANTPHGPIPFALVATGALAAPCTEPTGAPSIGAVDPDTCQDGGVTVSWPQDVASWNDGGPSGRGYRVIRDGLPIGTGGCAGTLSYGTTSCVDDTGPDNFPASYRVEYRSGCGATVRSAATTATDAVTHKVDVTGGGTTVCADVDVDFLATPDPTNPAFTYQWTEDGVDIPGAVSTALTLTKAVGESHEYNCRVTDPGNSCSVVDPLPVTQTWLTNAADVSYDSGFDPVASREQLCGDGDSFVEPGEVWRVTVRLDNAAVCGTASDTTANLLVAGTSQVAATICDNPGSFGDIEPGADASETFAFEVSEAGACPGSVTFDVDDLAWVGGSGPAAPAAFAVSMVGFSGCNVSPSCSCSSVAFGEVSADPAKQLLMRKTGGSVDLIFENVGAPNYNVYVSTEPGTQAFQVDSALGKRDCGMAWNDAGGGLGEITGYDVEGGIAAASDAYYLLITGDDGSPTESTLGTTSLTGDRTADSYCAR